MAELYYHTDPNDFLGAFAAEDLRGAQFCAVTFNAQGRIARVAAAGGEALGLLHNMPRQGEEASVHYRHGAHPARAGAALPNRLAKLTTDAQGRLVVAGVGAAYQYKNLTVTDAADTTVVVVRERGVA